MSPRNNESVECIIEFTKNEARSEQTRFQIFTPSVISKVTKQRSANLIDVDLSSPDDREILYLPHWLPPEPMEPTRPSDDESESDFEDNDSDMVVEYDSDESIQEISIESEEESPAQSSNESEEGDQNDVQVTYENIILDDDEPPEIIDVENGELEVMEILNQVSFMCKSLCCWTNNNKCIVNFQEIHNINEVIEIIEVTVINQVNINNLLICMVKDFI